jgi:hypothetical protein
MADHEADDSETQSSPRRAWAKALVVCAVMGGAYGAAIGTIIATTDGAAKMIGGIAGIVALLFAIPGARYGFFFGNMNRVRFGKLFVATVAAVIGAILSGFLGIVATMPLGALIGAVCGWFLGRSISQRDCKFRNGLLGVFFGVCVEAAILVLRRDEAAGLPGAIWGLGIGVVIGPLLFLLFIGTLNSLPPTHGNDRGKGFDATFRR